MDLLSILNESGSTSDERMQGMPRNADYDDHDDDDIDDDDDNDTDNTIDIEDILREDDDDDDDDDFDATAADDDELDRPVWNNSRHLPLSSSSSIMTRVSTVNAKTNGNEPARYPTRNSYTSHVSSHNPEDWAVLQHILNEDDDDDEEDEWMSTAAASKYSLLHQLDANVSSRHQQNVDILVQSSSEDEEEAGGRIGPLVPTSDASASVPVDVPTAQSPTVQAPTTVSSDSPLALLQPSMDQDETGDKSKSFLKEVANGTTSVKVSPKLQEKKLTTEPSSIPSLFQRAEGVFRNSQQRPRIEDRSLEEEEVYRRSLSHAQSLERKLLKSGHCEIVSPLMVKRRLKPKIELSARFSPQQLKQSSNTQQQLPNKNERLSTVAGPRFGFSGIVENKKMASVSASLVKHADPGATKVLCGLPTCLAFNSKFIAIGTQLGFILIFDLFEVLRQRLGSSIFDESSIDRKAGSITSLDLSHNGEAVVAGYASGILVLWDTIRGTVLRSVTDSHPSPITAVRFLNELKMVTVDSGGLVHKLTFTKNLIWANYSVETECLLDGTAGQILAMNVLQPFSTVKPLVRPEAFAKVLRNLTLIALSSERSSFAVAVDPKVNVLHRWARPSADRTNVLHGTVGALTDKAYLPCLSWGWALISGGGNVVMPVLARSWGCCLQLLCASFPTLDDDNPVRIGEAPVVHWPAFGVHKEIDATSPIIGLEWLNDRSLAFLTASYELTLVDTVMMTLLDRLDFSGLKLVYAEFSLSRAATSSDNGSTATLCKTFLNSTRCSDDRIMVICQDELRCISIVGARRRISALEADGEWLEALAFALDHYENTVVSQEDRRRDPNARKDLSRHPEFSAAKSEEEEWIAKLLIRYLNLAVENAPEKSSAILNSPYSVSSITSRIDLAQSHFQMLAGVCVEFCVATRRLDLLFGPIFRRFQSVGYIAIFLDVLEPYVLNDKLKYIAPEAMSYFVEHCKATNGIATVERCLLHLDCTIMDFDSILSLLRANEMFSALFYVFNQGLDDYVTPLEILLEKVFSEADSGGASVVRRKDGVLQNDFERLGYKALLYLQTCFAGKAFPQESELEPEERSHSLKFELLKFLMQETFSPSPHIKKAVNLVPVVGQRSLPFPYIRVLLLVDPRGMLDTISVALDASGPCIFRSRSTSESFDGWVDGGSAKSKHIASLPNMQEIMVDLASVLMPKSSMNQSISEANVFRSRGAVNAFLDFVAKFIINGTVQVEESVTFMILSRVANQYASARDSDGRQKYQRKVMDILSALPRESYDPDQVLAVFNQSHMHRAALLLHQQVASSWNDVGHDDIELRSRHFLSAIDCYVEDEDPALRLGVFDYVKKECSGVSDITPSKEGGQPKSLRDALFSRLSVLVYLNALRTAHLVAELFVDDLDQVIDSLESRDGGRGQFLFLQTIVSGDLVEVDPVAGSVLNLTMEHHHKYLALMAKQHPDMVYEYLSTHDNYRTEECLRLCEEHDIADASAYLLERMGKVTNALQLILQTLETRMMGLKRTIRGTGVDVIRQHNSRPLSQGRHGRNLAAPVLPSKHQSDVDNVRRILIVALDLCERNSGSFSPANERASKFTHGELWFSVFDRLINSKGFLRLSKELPEHAKIMTGVLSELLRLTMQRMVSSVPLSDLVRKVTADHSGSQIGELREMVEGLLATYGFELNVFKGAITAFHDDVYSMRKTQLQLCLRGSQVQSVMNLSLVSSAGKLNDASSVLQHPSYQSGVLRVTSNGNATFIDNDRFSSSRRAETGLVDAMKRLRSRRGVGTIKRHSSDLNMMTVTERMYHDKQTEPVVYGERPVGALGEAEHRGRLMTFSRF